MRAAFTLFLLGLPVAADTAVTASGVILRGQARMDGEGLVLKAGSKERRHPRADLVLVEADDGTLIYAPDPEARLRGYVYLARERRSVLAAELAEEAVRARHARLSRRLLDVALASGFSGDKANTLKTSVEDLERAQPQANEARARAVRARLGELAAIYPDLLVQRAASDVNGDLALLRTALRTDPMHAGGQALLAERAPKDFVWGPATFWLDWRLDLEPKGAHLLATDDPQFAATRAQWRKDLYGVQIGQIRMVTPVRDTTTVGRCLAYGDLACTALREVFHTASPKARASSSLLLLLYPSTEEYLDKSVKGESGEERERLATTAGHYSPLEGLSRLVWDRNPDAERRIARVFVHELTHHWIMEQNPSYADADVRRDPTLPGYWIVEGLATFFEEGSFDIEAGTWTLFDARATSLDSVQALALQGKLLPWENVYGLDQDRFQSVPRGKESAMEFVRRWHVGTVAITPARLFYEQAASTVHFLYHGENGAYRERLIDYVTNYYTGKEDRLAIEAAFGLTPAELGKRVEAYASQVASGWRPGR